VSHAHTASNAAIARVLDVSWQSCRVHFMRTAPARAGKSGRRIIIAFIATAFTQDVAEAVRAQWRYIADQLRPKLPRLASLDEAIVDVGFQPIGNAISNGDAVRSTRLIPRNIYAARNSFVPLSAGITITLHLVRCGESTALSPYSGAARHH